MYECIRSRTMSVDAPLGPANKTAKDASAKKTAAKKQLRWQIYPQRQVLIEYPAQRGVHRMRGCEVAAEPAVHQDDREKSHCARARRTDRLRQSRFPRRHPATAPTTVARRRPPNLHGWW